MYPEPWTRIAILLGLFALCFTFYSFGAEDGAERWMRISKAEGKLMCGRMNSERN
jgi:hypothetical protein